MFLLILIAMNIDSLQLSNEEFFWVITEVCSEANLMKRAKIIKHFIRVAGEESALSTVLLTVSSIRPRMGE